MPKQTLNEVIYEMREEPDVVACELRQASNVVLTMIRTITAYDITRATVDSFLTRTYDDVYTYLTMDAAWHAYVRWGGLGDAPVGWIRHRPSNRRRENGNPEKETIRA